MSIFGAQPTYLAGWLSEANSTTTTLGAGETFTGTPFRSQHSDLIVYSYSDVAGTLYVDLGIVNGNWRTSITYDCAAGASEFHTIVKGYRWCRVRYVNGAASQAVFELQTEAAQARQPNKGNQVGVGRDDDASVVRPSDFYQEVQEGRRSGYYMETKFGANDAAGTGAEDVWTPGGDYTGQPVGFTPETVDVFSSDDEDGGAGTDTGALTVRIRGLKTSASTAYETEDITLNGTTAVTSVNTWWRVNRAQVLTAGSGGANAGTITVRSTTTTANVFSVMKIGYNQSTVGAWTVPAGSTAWLKSVRLQITRATGTGVSAVATLRVRAPGGVYQVRRVYDFQGDAPIQYAALGGLQIDAGSDIKLRIESTTTTSPVEVTLEMLVVED